MDLIPSSGPHLHILLNHFPSIGAVIALGLVVAAYRLKSANLKRTYLVLFMLLGLLAIPTYISGAAAMWTLFERDDVALAVIPAHENVAMLAALFLWLTGCAAWLALWQERRFNVVPGASNAAVIVLAVISLFFMAWAGNIGGHINHPEVGAIDEIVLGPDVTSRADAIQGFINSYAWTWPAIEAGHFLGMALLFGVVLLVTLRVLGFTKNMPFQAVHRLLPLGVLGLFVNVMTGMVFFIVDSGRYVAMDGFPPKMALLVIGGVALLYFTIFDDAWKLKAGDDAPVTAKAMALVTVVSWAGVILFGRLLPYYGYGGF